MAVTSLLVPSQSPSSTWGRGMRWMAAQGVSQRPWCSMSVPVDEEKIREAADIITVQCRDPLDQKFFTLTLAGGAKLLVSKDKLVLKAGRKMKRYGACAFRPEETAARLDALS